MKALLFLTIAIISTSASALDSERVVYRVTIESLWNSGDHVRVPNSAHFSPVFAVSHNDNYSLFSIGEGVSSDFEGVAETGNTSGVERTAKKSQTQGSVHMLVVTENQFVLRSQIQTFDIEVTKNNPVLSFATMIAPSPDWVIGITGLKLYEEETGFTEFVGARNLYAMDAGTEAGDIGGNFSTVNRETLPRERLSLLTGTGFDKPFAIFSIRRL